MSRYLPYQDKKFHKKKLPRRVSDHYKPRALKSYELIEMTADDVTVAKIKARIMYEHGESQVDLVEEFILMSENQDGKTSFRWKDEHEWALYTSYV